jgi:hypothetical protein
MAEQALRVPHVDPDRVFFPLIALALIVFVIVGFAPTYYFKTLTGAPELSLAVHLHGFLFSLWVALFFAQTLLIRSGRRALHRRIGIAGAGLAVSMIVIATIVTMRASTRFPEPPWLFAVTFGDLLMFAVFVALAVNYRTVGVLHKRFMLLATVAILDAAVARWPIVAAVFGDDPASIVGSFWMYVGTDLPIVAAVVYDKIVHGRIQPVLTWGGLVLVASQAARLAVVETPLWQAVSEVLVRLAQ